MSKYWVLLDRRVAGPYTPEALPGLPGYGPATLVSPEEKGKDMFDWLHAGEIPELYPHLGIPPEVVADVYDPQPKGADAKESVRWQRAIIAGLREGFAQACRQQTNVRQALETAQLVEAQLQAQIEALEARVAELRERAEEARKREEAARAERLALSARQRRLESIAERLRRIKEEEEKPKRKPARVLGKPSAKPPEEAPVRPARPARPKGSPLLGDLPVLKAPSLKPLE